METAIAPESARGWAILLVGLVFLFVAASEVAAVVRTRDSQDHLVSLEETSDSVSALDRAMGSFLDGATNLSVINSPEDAPSLAHFQQEVQLTRESLTLARDTAASQGRDDQARLIERTQQMIDEFADGAEAAALLYLDGGSADSQAEAQLAAAGGAIVAQLQSAAETERAVLEAERDAASDALNATLIIRMVFGSIAILGGGVALSVLMLRVVRPLRALGHSVRAIARGDLDHRAAETGPEEVRSLARDVNLMAESMIARNLDLERAGNSLKALNENLEQRVRERTESLSQLNDDLKAEIEDRTRAQEALAESEELFSRAFRASPTGISLTDFETGRFVDLNGQCLEYIGLPRDDVIGHTSMELGLWPEEQQRLDIGRALGERGEIRDLELKFRRASDGAILDILCSFTRVDVRGRATVLSVLQDITESKRAHRALTETSETLSALFDASPVAILAIDSQANVTLWNSAAERMFGWAAHEVIGKPYPLVPDDRAGEFERLKLKVFGGSGFSAFETRRRKKSGDLMDVSVSTTPIRDSQGNVEGVVAVVEDISHRKRAENALRESEERYRNLFMRNLAGVYRTTVEGDVIECNDALARMLGYDSPDEILLRPVLENYPHPEERAVFLDKLRANGRVEAHETHLLRKDGTPVWVLESAHLTHTNEHPDGVIEGTMIDITDRRRAEETIRHLAYHDTLTDLPNRSLFVDRLRQSIARARRTGEMVGVLFLDLDHFKDVNDSAGHAEGDMLLRNVATRLKDFLRDGDTLARFGGDEFVLLLPELESVEDATNAADRILKAMRKPWRVNGRELHLAASIGITIAPLDGEDPETLLRNADTAMYRAKEHGRNSFELYTADMNARIVARLSLENAIRRAIKNNEFVLHYQPQVDILTGEIVGVEALVRWQHPERGLVLPGEFITVAEASGLIGPIGDWVLRQACEDGRRWSDQGLPAIRIAVNLSARQFEHRDLVDKIASVLKETGLTSGRLQVEITEGIAMADVGFTISTLNELRAMGVKVAIDDFGTGHSSLSYIKNLPIDAVKIDGSFIHDISTDSVDAAIVTAIVAISHSMRLNVIAEGVETAEQFEFLRDPRNYLGLVQDRPCDEYQGFLFSKAVPAGEIAALIRGARKATTHATPAPTP